MKVSMPNKETKVMRIPLELEGVIKNIVDNWKIDQVLKNHNRNSQSEDQVSA